MEVSSRKFVESVILLFATGSAVAGFASVSLSVSTDGEKWLLPGVWFSVLAVSFLLASVLYRERFMRVAFVGLVLAPSLLFTPTLAHLFFTVLSSMFLLSGFRKIDEDVQSRMTISFRRSVSIGAFSFVFPLALLIASQYYAEIRHASWQDLVPRFSLVEGGGDFVLRAAGIVSPEVGKIRNEETTVDSFLSTARGTGTGPVSEESLSDPAAAMVAALSLEAGRIELGKLVGRDLSGDERMADVLSEALRNKTLAFLSGAKAERNLPNGVLPFFLALLLFITVFSIASLLRGIWIFCAAGLLWLLVRTGALSIEKIPAEQEILK